MPTYEYRCPDGHEFERFYRKISDAPQGVLCPVCNKPAERRLSAGAGLVFKGSGFYLTDYGKNAHRAGPPPSSGEGKSEDSSSKPAAGDAPKDAAKAEGAATRESKGDAGAPGTSSTKAGEGKPGAPSKSSEAKPASDAPKKSSKPDA